MSTEMTVQELGREKIELIKQTVAKGATDLELELFLHACKHTGLDPLMKQIYAIKRWSQADGREVLSFQTGIDGYRLIADRTGKYAGSSDATYEEKDGKPILAQVTVLKIIEGEKCAFTASARWEEYVQRNRQTEPTSMWKKMPYLMLAKCAEAQALRKAFPMELSGLYTHDEMMHRDSEWKESLQGNPSEIAARLEQGKPLAPAEPAVTSGTVTTTVEQMEKDIETGASTFTTLPHINSVLADLEAAPDTAAKSHIFNEAMALPYSEVEKQLLIKAMKKTGKKP